jgi:hypothetical protein
MELILLDVVVNREPPVRLSATPRRARRGKLNTSTSWARWFRIGVAQSSAALPPVRADTQPRDPISSPNGTGESAWELRYA